MRPPRIPLVSNVTALPLWDPTEIKAALARQVCSRVLWERSMRHAVSAGIDAVLEPGPGSVLCGLMRRIAKDPGATPRLRSVEEPVDLEGSG